MNTAEPAFELPRVPSGVPGFDTILKGGFLQGGIYIIMGAPGTGKTILSNQICYHHVAAGGRALYVTLLAESHARLLAHLRGMSFFDLSTVARSLHYISGYHTLETDGLRGLLKLLHREIRTHKATMLVIDGLTTVEALIESDLTLKHFLHDLQVYNETTQCTAFLLTQPNSEPSHYPGHTVVDGIVELSRLHAGPRAIREVEVHKLRGSDFLEGRHRVRISDSGLTFYPRVEVLFQSQSPYDELHNDRMAFGIPRLDEMLQGGVPVASTTLLLGAPGTGKTILGTHFLATGAAKGQRGLYFGFYERPAHLVHKTNQLGLDLGTYVKSGLLSLQWQSPLELIPDALVDSVIQTVREQQITRVFLDGLEGFNESEIYPDRITRMLTALSNELRSLGVTTLFTVELSELFSPNISVPIKGISAIVDNIIFLRYVELRSQLYRLISVMKMRESAYDPAIREFKITEHGIDVAPTFESAEAILTGVARPYMNVSSHQRQLQREE